MENHSLNKLSWEKLKNNRTAYFSLFFIIFCIIISLFSVLISPDKTPMANEMHIELSALDPFSDVTFLEIPKDNNSQNSFLEDIFIGIPLEVSRIPIDSFSISDSSIIYYPYNSTLSEIYSGRYDITNQVYWLGTDLFGRDFLSRILYGTRISLSVGFIAVFISLIIGISLGLFAGYFRGLTDDIIMWFVNVIWSIPTLLMVIAITLALGKGFWQIFIAVGLTMWVEVTRIIRGQVLVIRELEFVEAGKALAFSNFRIMFRHIFPNVIGPLIVISAANFSAAILIEAGLSFLGIGAQPPIPTWGGMIKEHYPYIIMDKSFLAVIPGLAIISLVFSFMLLGNGLRDAFDVRE